MGAKRSAAWPAFEKKLINAHPYCSNCGIPTYTMPGTTLARLKAKLFTRLTGHHTIPFSVDPSKELDPDNILILCDGIFIRKDKCHFQVGHNGRSWNEYNMSAPLMAAANLARVIAERLKK